MIVNVDWFFLSHRLPIALGAIEAGYEVHIATGITNCLQEMQSYGLRVHPIILTRGDTSVAKTLILGAQILKLLSTLKPDILHLVTIKPVLIGGILARLCRTPSVVSAISGLGFTFTDKSTKANLIKRLVSYLYQQAFGHKNLQVIVQNSNDLVTLQKITKLPEQRFTLLPGSGIDLKKFYPQPYPTGKPIVMLASRMLMSKGVQEFVEAARYLSQEKEVDARFVLVGSPDPYNPTSLTEEQLIHWQQESIIEWWGHRTDMAATINEAHIIVLPSSYGEGLPKVLIEAAACGRPIVTTNIPGCRDAIEANVTGFLVPVKDVDALAAAMESLILDPQQRASMGQAGRQRAEAYFAIEDIVAAHLRIYSEMYRSANLTTQAPKL
ncbi:glycosyl transferase family 1 [Leptolyngbya sp. BL0902]|nr:glycosyl transferase family 1 [Leptolyngbya sp. BL0902]